MRWSRLTDSEIENQDENYRPDRRGRALNRNEDAEGRPSADYYDRYADTFRHTHQQGTRRIDDKVPVFDRYDEVGPDEGRIEFGSDQVGNDSGFMRRQDPGMHFVTRRTEPSRGRYSGRGPKGYQRSDERIRDDVSDALSDHPDVDASDIEVFVKNGEVTLTGTVPDRRMKRLAEDAAERCRGVKDVHNELHLAFISRTHGAITAKEQIEKEHERF